MSEESAPVSARDRAMALVSNAAPAASAEPAPPKEAEAGSPIGGETPEPAEAAFTNDAAESPNASAAAKAKAKQETLQFESTTRGRFDKSEPTIVEGEDLDVPTFLRVRKPD
jgi:cell division protein FtsZ